MQEVEILPPAKKVKAIVPPPRPLAALPPPAAFDSSSSLSPEPEAQMGGLMSPNLTSMTPASQPLKVYIT